MAPWVVRREQGGGITELARQPEPLAAAGADVSGGRGQGIDRDKLRCEKRLQHIGAHDSGPPSFPRAAASFGKSYSAGTLDKIRSLTLDESRHRRIPENVPA